MRMSILPLLFCSLFRHFISLTFRVSNSQDLILLIPSLNGTSSHLSAQSFQNNHTQKKGHVEYLHIGYIDPGVSASIIINVD